MREVDIVIAGGGFAGLACAKAAAKAGLSTVVLERKKVAGQGMHTTGILVKEAAEELKLPENLVRRITEVRLYAPNMRYVELHSPDYFFLATDTPGLMQHFSGEAEAQGAEVRYSAPYEGAVRKGDRIVLEEAGLSCKFLIGADGPRSKVAEDFNLGKNEHFLLGAEAEYAELGFDNPDAFYCFLDNKLAHGYLGWVIPGVGLTQAGVATRMPQRPDIDAFCKSVSSVFPLDESKVIGRRGGLIPCGGLVRKFANDRVILLGDSAGIVSPLTAGGIHTALFYGRILGDALGEHLLKDSEHPAALLQRSYPRFREKLFLRWCFERFAPNPLLNVALGNPLFKRFAENVFFSTKQLKGECGTRRRAA